VGLDSDGSQVSAGLGFSRAGLSLSAGLDLAVERLDQPALTFSFQWKPAGSKITRLDSQLREFASRGEALAIAEAEKKFRGLVQDYERRREELLWQTRIYDEEAELYRINAEEQQRWLERGLIREMDYQDAETKYRMALNRVQSVRVDRRLYNLELAGHFREAGQ
jgi:hypothetical protein